jgi:hypothetical protein
MTPHQPATEGLGRGAAADFDRAAKDTLAALRGLSLLDYEAVAERLRVDPETYRVDTLPLLPDDGIGVGEATLHCIPANLYGDPATHHRTTWAVSVAYDYDGPEDWDLVITDNETEARDSHAQRVAGRLADGCPDPNETASD